MNKKNEASRFIFVSKIEKLNKIIILSTFLEGKGVGVGGVVVVVVVVVVEEVVGVTVVVVVVVEEEVVVAVVIVEEGEA